MVSWWKLLGRRFLPYRRGILVKQHPDRPLFAENRRITYQYNSSGIDLLTIKGVNKKNWRELGNPADAARFRSPRQHVTSVTSERHSLYGDSPRSLFLSRIAITLVLASQYGFQFAMYVSIIVKFTHAGIIMKSY